MPPMWRAPTPFTPCVTNREAGGMFQHYLITALRNFSRHKIYSFINIAGLTIGLTCAIFIILFVRDQLSYDRWIPDNENLYRLEVRGHLPGEPPVRFSQAS